MIPWKRLSVGGAALALGMVVRSWYEATPLNGVEAPVVGTVIMQAASYHLVVALVASDRRV